MSDNKYKVEFVEFEIRDYDTSKSVFKVSKRVPKSLSLSSVRWCCERGVPPATGDARLSKILRVLDPGAKAAALEWTSKLGDRCANNTLSTVVVVVVVVTNHLCRFRGTMGRI